MTVNSSMTTQTESHFLNAFKGTNTRVPVWIMRQAGRYLPEYQAFKKDYTLDEMFQNPEIASQITVLPIDILDVDAAILFADILTLPRLMGVNIHFDNQKGPIVEILKTVETLKDIDSIQHVHQTIQLTKSQLPKHIPLIGFAGSPFTVATYLIEGGSSLNYLKTFELLYNSPDFFHALMQKLTDNTIIYLKAQKEAGIDAFQLFDSWAGILRAEDYTHFVLPYVQQIFSNLDIPSIYFVKNTHHLLHLMELTDADILSVDHTVTLGQNPILANTQKGVQGNLFNGLLYAKNSVLEKEVATVLAGASNYDKYIFNLSHGVMPNVDPEKLKNIVKQVHAYPWKKNLKTTS